MSSATPESSTEAPNSRFVGEWAITWLDNQTVNALTLAIEGERLVGRYVSDDGEVCPVRAGVSSSGAAIHITVACVNWEILMDGSPTDGDRVEGEFLAYGHSRGRFTMER